ncbi:MAG: hypothetical protein AAF078_00055 [Planctomycetota bacterium]
MPAVVSYPKSGRTWLRFMLDDYLARLRGDTDLQNVFAIEQKPGYPIHWTHFYGAMLARRPYWAMGPIDASQLGDVPVLILTRDLLDTLRSAYHHAVHRIGVFEGTPTDFVRCPRYGIAKIVTFYNQMHDLRRRLERPYMLDYRQLKACTPDTLTQAIAMFEIPLDTAIIDPVVEAASAERMRTLGTTPEYAGTPLAPADTANPDSFKVRSAGSPRVDPFSADDLAYAMQVIDALYLPKDDPDFARCLPPAAASEQPAAETPDEPTRSAA